MARATICHTKGCRGKTRGSYFHYELVPPRHVTFSSNFCTLVFESWKTKFFRVVHYHTNKGRGGLFYYLFFLLREVHFSFGGGFFLIFCQLWHRLTREKKKEKKKTHTHTSTFVGIVMNSPANFRFITRKNQGAKVIFPAGNFSSRFSKELALHIVFVFARHFFQQPRKKQCDGRLPVVDTTM